jgi:hypothetical protein
MSKITVIAGPFVHKKSRDQFSRTVYGAKLWIFFNQAYNTDLPKFTLKYIKKKIKFLNASCLLRLSYITGTKKTS